MDVSDIARMLADRIDSLVPSLLPAAVKEGHEWRVGGIDGSKGRSMAIHSNGPRRGVWKDFSSNDLKGDALDLVSLVMFAGDKKRAVAWAKSWLGIDGLDPARLKREQVKIQQRAKEDERKAIEDAERRAKRAQALWLNASAALSGTPVDLYLLGRGIGIADLPRPPGALRYAPSLEYPADLNGGVKTSWPAMVAAICNGDGQHIATHRTFLSVRGGGLVTKAPVKDAKLTLGSYRGGFISLTRGASGKALKDAPEGDRVILCEGIEDGLSLALCCPEFRVLAAISVGNFQNVQLPPAIKDVVIAADNDAPDSAAGRALQAAIDAFLDQGREVSVARSPVGKDFNDALQSQAAAILTREVQ